MSFYWLEPGWKSARCACGANIWDTGGDPDWGACFNCFSRQTNQEKAYEAAMNEQYAEQYAARMDELQAQSHLTPPSAREGET